MVTFVKAGHIWLGTLDTVVQLRQSPKSVRPVISISQNSLCVLRLATFLLAKAFSGETGFLWISNFIVTSFSQAIGWSYLQGQRLWDIWGNPINHLNLFHPVIRLTAIPSTLSLSPPTFDGVLYTLIPFIFRWTRRIASALSIWEYARRLPKEKHTRPNLQGTSSLPAAVRMS